MNYEDKYIKYKQKYLILTRNKNMKGGSKIYEKKFKMLELFEDKIYGLNNIDDEILTTKSQFAIGSLTKLFTIIVLLLLHQQGKIDLLKTFSENCFDNEKLSDTKIIDVINHISGIKIDSDTHNYEIGSLIKFKNATEVYDTFKNQDLIIKSVENYLYSNIGYIILGALIEKITGNNFKKVFNDLLFKPLDMNITGFDKSNIILYNNKAELLNKNMRNERTYASTAGQAISSIDDLLKFVNFPELLNSES